MDPELVFKATEIQKKSEEMESSIQNIDSEISELQQFVATIEEIEDSEQDETLSSLGKGVFIKTKIEEKKLLVNVGSSVVLEKTPKEVKSVILDQIKKLREVKMDLLGRLDSSRSELMSLINSIQEKER
jgi:prefoldin alpha subunit